LTASIKANVDGSAAIQVGGSDAINISSGLSVGIGTSSPAASLSVTKQTTALSGTGNSYGLYMYPTSSGLTYIDAITNSTGNTSLGFRTYNNGTYNEMRMDSSGNVGIGTSSPGAKLDVRGSSTFLVNATNPTAWVSVDSALTTGSMYNQWNTTSNVGISGTYTNHAYTFVTNNTERARIDTSGNLLVGTTTQVGKLNVVASSNIGAGYNTYFRNTWSGDVGYPALYIAKFDNNTTTSQLFIRFSVNNEATSSGQINANGANSAAFGTFSDKRLKTNIQDLPSQLANIMALRPVEYDYIESEGGGHQIGFVAQEVQEIYPDLVGDRGDGMLTLTDMNKNDARLIKAIQEQQQMIETLQAKVAALEGA